MSSRSTIDGSNCICVFMRRHIEICGVDPRYHEFVFSNITKDQHNGRLVGELEDILQNWTTTPVELKSFLVNGGTGTGKTTIFSALVHELVSMKKRAYIINAKEFIDKNYDAIDASKAERRRIEDELDRIEHADYIILDDVGCEGIKTGEKGEWIRSNFYGLIEKYWSHKKALTVTTNLAPDMFEEKVGQRIASRLKGMCRLRTLTGPDRRYQ
jgi:DNA replication protein DnaC